MVFTGSLVQRLSLLILTLGVRVITTTDITVEYITFAVFDDPLISYTNFLLLLSYHIQLRYLLHYIEYVHLLVHFFASLFE